MRLVFDLDAAFREFALSIGWPEEKLGPEMEVASFRLRSLAAIKGWVTKRSGAAKGEPK